MKILRIFRKARKEAPDRAIGPHLSIGQIDAELRKLIAKFALTPSSQTCSRDDLLARIHSLKQERHELTRPRQFSRMLASLG